MSNELQGIELRLIRAHEHIDTLKHESRMFMMEFPSPYGSTIEDKSVNGDYIVRAKIFRPAPVRLGILAVDAAHNLRAALDMIAWQLAIKGPNPPLDDDRATAFPICTHPDAWESDRTKRMIERIPSDAIDVIHKFQPYNAPSTLGKLAFIQAVDNWGKHKSIPGLLSFHVSRIKIISPFRLVYKNLGPFNDGDEICRVQRIQPISETNEHFQSLMFCHVGFAKGGPGAGYPIDFLANSHEFIRDTILPAFQKLFPES